MEELVPLAPAPNSATTIRLPSLHFHVEVHVEVHVDVHLEAHVEAHAEGEVEVYVEVHVDAHRWIGTMVPLE
jgi:hypothetical protein